MITGSDAVVIRSLLRKAQAVSLQLSEDVANTGVTGAKRMPSKDRVRKIQLLHCYVTVANRYVVESQS